MGAAGASGGFAGWAGADELVGAIVFDGAVRGICGVAGAVEPCGCGFAGSGCWFTDCASDRLAASPNTAKARVRMIVMRVRKSIAVQAGWKPRPAADSAEQMVLRN